MGSGYGWFGGRSRCFTYWQEFQKCYAQSENPTECRSQSNDYLECLHHTEEIKRTQAIQSVYSDQIEKAKKGPKESHEAVNAVVSPAEGPAGVGLVKDEPDVAK